MRVKYHPSEADRIARPIELDSGDFGVIIAPTAAGVWVCFHQYRTELIHTPGNVLRGYGEDCFDEFLDDLDLRGEQAWAAVLKLADGREMES
jgi:hypothetical protein